MNKTLLNNVATYAHNHTLYQENDTLIVGLSGGPDSLFLLHALAAERTTHNLTLIAAHLNHEWRTEAEDDVKFCQEQCDALGIGFVAQKLSDLSLPHKFNGSKEEFARNARRYFFENLRQQYNAQHIAVAHTADDQEETFFIRLLRGSSLTGLVGMRPKNGYYIRPLLGTRKEELLHYLHTHDIAYLHDWTNDTDDYLRNRIRRHVLPALRTVDARFSHNLARTGNQLFETELFLEKLTQQHFAALRMSNTPQIILNLTALRELDPFMQRRILLHWFCQEGVAFSASQTFFAEILRFISSARGGTHQLGTTWKLIKQKNRLFIDIQFCSK